MTRFTTHNRNHSFPPAVRYVQKPSKTLSQPLPDIDDEPWVHFLADDDEDDEQYADYLHFDAGILTGSESRKRKTNKFKPFSVEADRTMKQHHGAIHRRQLEHGFLQQERETANASTQSLGDPVHGRTARRRVIRRHSGHRHSWQEPSLFTVTEEIPRIIISDFDDGNSSIDGFTSTESLGDSLSEISAFESEEIAPKHAETETSTATPAAAPESPRINASIPAAARSDSQLNQMWLAERARL